MEEKTLEERIQYISFLHKQNLNGRETEDELFEAGILAGIEETELISYSAEEVFKMINDFCFDWNYNYKGELSQKQYLIEWFEKLEKK
jgi:hypothetical protein